MNLINDAWIPVRRADGTPDKIEPWRMTDHVNSNRSPIVTVASPRPDFDGALTQFLIGLLQTTCTPDENGWWDWREKPPSPEVLRERLSTVTKAFEFEGNGPRFMQDLTLSSADFSKKQKKKKSSDLDEDEFEDGLTPVSSIFIEAPGKITRVENRDHFVKREFIEKLCSHCAAAALFTLQTNSPGRGSGYRTSLRGGGPLTTIVLHENSPDEKNTLWTRCWLNVLDKTVYLSGQHGNPERQCLEDRFPWLAPMRTSENNGVTTPDDIHPDQQYWAMPQRIRLLQSGSVLPEPCDLCGGNALSVYRYYYAKKFGVNYKGDFRHPLSPYDVVDGHLRAVLTEPGGVGYRHWLGIIENEPSTVRQRAKVVERFVSKCRADAQVWAFGYDIHNSNKVRGWSDASLPVFHFNKEVREQFIPVVKNMTIVANRVCGYLLLAVFRANFMEPKAKRKTKGQEGADFLEVVWECPKSLRKFNKSEDRMDEVILKDQRAMTFSARSEFWDRTEGAFLNAMNQAKRALSDGLSEVPALQTWFSVLRNGALGVFDTYSQNGDFDVADPRRVALARNDLAKALNGRKVRDLLGLPRREPAET